MGIIPIEVRVHRAEIGHVGAEHGRPRVEPPGGGGVRVDVLVHAEPVVGIGRFLEHGRIYYFHNGGRPEYYIGSADAMQRNLEKRVEVLVPIEDARLQAELRFWLDSQLSDQRGAWNMLPDGSYARTGMGAKHSQVQAIERAERRLKEATRLRRRKVQIARRTRR